MSTLDSVDAEQLRSALHDLPDATPAMRLMVAIAYLDGVSVATLSDRYGVPRSTIYAWLDRFEGRPIAEAARDDDRPGRPPALTDAQRSVLADALAQAPEDYGLDGEEWTASLVREFLEDRFGIAYSRVHAWRLMRSADSASPD